MKKSFILLLIGCATIQPMHQSSLLVVDGENQSKQEFSLGRPDEVVAVRTENDELPARYEHALLSGLLSLYQDLAYGVIDLRPLEQAIAAQHGHPDVFKSNHEYRTDADCITQHTDPAEIMFTQSSTKIKSTFRVPALAQGQTVKLRTNLTDRKKLVCFLNSVLNPSRIDSADGGARQRLVLVSELEQAVLAELASLDD